MAVVLEVCLSLSPLKLVTDINYWTLRSGSFMVKTHRRHTLTEDTLFMECSVTMKREGEQIDVQFKCTYHSYSIGEAEPMFTGELVASPWLKPKKESFV